MLLKASSFGSFSVVAAASVVSTFIGSSFFSGVCSLTVTEATISAGFSSVGLFLIRDNSTLLITPLVGVKTSLCNNNSYLYFAGAYLGIEASADLNSARLFLVPAALLAVAWARVARPVLGQMIASVTLDRLTRFTWKSIAILSVLNCLFVAIILWMLPWLQQNLLGAKYQRAPDLVPLWGVYLVLNSSRTVGTTVLMCYGWFKELFSQGLLSLVVLTLGCVILMPRFGVVGALSAMILVELIELFTNLFYLLPKARSRH